MQAFFFLGSALRELCWVAGAMWISTFWMVPVHANGV